MIPLALCTLIGQTIRAVQVLDLDRIELTMPSATLLIPLDIAGSRGREAAHFVPARADGSLRVEAMLIW